MNWNLERLEKRIKELENEKNKPVENAAKPAREKPFKITITITGRIVPCTVILIL